MKDPIKILIVDDHPENLMAIEVVLTGLGHELVRAESGPEALKKLLDQDFALILMDVQMQGLNGFETAELIRARERSRLTPIIFLTGLSKAEPEVERGYSLGAVDYMFKPFIPEILRAKVAVFVDLFRKTRQVEEQADRLLALNDELKRSNAELDAFAAIASHDLQEPLRKIVTFGDRLKTQVEAGNAEQANDSVSRMQSAAHRMRRLIEELLTYSRVSTKLGVPEEVDLQAVAEGVIVDLEETLSKSGGRVQVKPLPAVRADHFQMVELIQNLLSNAVKFTRKGEPPRVTLSGCVLSDGSIQIEVEDSGIGFDEKYTDRIFKPFQRLHSRTEYEGTGMGLAICQKIVHRHGGTLRAHSAPGMGARFIVTFPPSRKPEPKELDQASGPGQAGRGSQARM